MRRLVTEGQRDPTEVVDRIVEVVEADATEENNFVPPDIRDQLGA